MTEQFSWGELRDRLCAAFGDNPSASQEETAITVFRERPAFVVSSAEEVKRAYKAGRIQRPWPFLVKMLSERKEVVVTGESGLKKAVLGAEQWVRSAGILYDRFSEVDDELFGELGRYREYAGNEVFRARIRRLWETERPRGEAVELESTERAERHRANHAKIHGR